MLFAFRYLLARYLVHPLEGITFADWLRLLRRERYRIDPVCWPRALWLTGLSLWNSFAARRVQRRFGAAIAATRVEAPGLHPRPLPERDDPPPRAAVARPQVRLAEPVPDVQPPDVPRHRVVARPDRRAVHAPPPGAGGRDRIYGPDRALALHGLGLPPEPNWLRTLPHVPRGRPRRRRRLVERGGRVPQGPDAQERPAAHPEIAATHRADEAAPRPLPRRPVHPHPPRPVHRLRLDRRTHQGRPADLPPPACSARDRRGRHPPDLHDDVRRLLHRPPPDPARPAHRDRV